MSPTASGGAREMMKKPDDLLGNGYYFHWEFKMKMTLARKGLRKHIMEMNAEEDSEPYHGTEVRGRFGRSLGIKYITSFRVIARGVEVDHLSKIRHARNAKKLRDTPE